jgi:hypothetical protein
MALPSSGAISLSQVNTELGVASTATRSLNDSTTRTLFGVASGAISMSNGYGKSAVDVITVSSSTNANVLSLYTAQYGAPSGAKNVVVNIGSGVTVGATAGNTALTVGQFPTGSTITINNSGNIHGYGGAAGTSTTGGAGGDAINANYANQTVVINNQATGTIRGGGGGGGKGGTGGQGSYTYNSAGAAFTQYSPEAGYVAIKSANCANSYMCIDFGYCYPVYDSFDVIEQTNLYTCHQTVVNTAYTSGGAGGNGGVGQGYNQSNAAGSGGAAGGTNAGTGGTGGTGAAWGTAGATGNTGASGNYTAGSAGSAGGAAGRYLVKGANSVTLNNSGTVSGSLA